MLTWHLLCSQHLRLDGRPLRIIDIYFSHHTGFPKISGKFSLGTDSGNIFSVFRNHNCFFGNPCKNSWYTVSFLHLWSNFEDSPNPICSMYNRHLEPNITDYNLRPDKYCSSDWHYSFVSRLQKVFSHCPECNSCSVTYTPSGCFCVTCDRKVFDFNSIYSKYINLTD